MLKLGDIVRHVDWPIDPQPDVVIVTKSSKLKVCVITARTIVRRRLPKEN